MQKKLNLWSLAAALPIILELVDVVLRLVKALGVPVDAEQPVAQMESLEEGFDVGAPEPPNVEFLPLNTIYLFPSTTGTKFDPNLPFRKEWADPDAQPDDELTQMITYPRTFRGMDANGNPVFRPLTIPVAWARVTNSPQADSGNVDNRKVLPFPCRELYWWERVIPSKRMPGVIEIENTAYKPPANEPTEFSEGDRTMIREIHGAIVGRK